MVIDCFLFKDELDLLEVRLNELQSVVDVFVLVESTKTFAGTPKPLVFHENRARFEHFGIEHVVVDDMPETNDRWQREYHQRNAMVRGLKHAHDEDLVLMSDVDEIPRASMLEVIMAPGNLIRDKVYSFNQDHFYYYLNALDPEPWWGTKLCTYRHLRGTTPQDLRCVFLRVSDIPVYEGGWHFGWLGDRAAFRAKAKDFCHPDLAQPEMVDDQYLLACFQDGWTAHNRHKLQFQPLDHRFPAFIRQNRERFAHLIR